jgi:hypothetical protein
MYNVQIKDNEVKGFPAINYGYENVLHKPKCSIKDQQQQWTVRSRHRL